MRTIINKKNSFSRVFEPITQRFVSADYVVNIEQSELDNIERIEFAPPKLGESNFGKFKVTYKVPHLCEVTR